MSQHDFEHVTNMSHHDFEHATNMSQSNIFQKIGGNGRGGAGKKRMR